MEQSEVSLGEKIYSHAYDSLIREMVKSMEVDETKIYPQKTGEFNHEDIQSWIGAVDFKNGKTPDIEVNLSADQGRDVLKFDIRDQKTVEGRDEKATKEELIYSILFYGPNRSKDESGGGDSGRNISGSLLPN